MKRLIILTLLTLFTYCGWAQQSSNPKVTIQTNGVSAQCKKIMMENVPTWRGVKSCNYDMATGKLSIVYDQKQTAPETLRKQVSNLGFNADQVKANEEARAKLPACCRNTQRQGHHCGGCIH